MTTGTLIFLDTETTSLRPDRRAWELGALIRHPDGALVRVHRFVFAEDLDLGNADLQSLRIGGYWDRHPQGGGDMEMPKGSELTSEYEMLGEFAGLSRGAHLVGSTVNFDADVLGARMREHGLLPAWDYRLVDVKNLAAGYLAMTAQYLDGPSFDPEPPWDSEELSKAMGIDLAGYDRHTALGDALWAMHMYDKVMGHRAPYQPPAGPA
jgi:hypothetical protein